MRAFFKKGKNDVIGIKAGRALDRFIARGCSLEMQMNGTLDARLTQYYVFPAPFPKKTLQSFFTLSPFCVLLVQTVLLNGRENLVQSQCAFTKLK
jgi:hypothetical protein